MGIQVAAPTDVFAQRAWSVLFARIGSSTQELARLREAFDRGALEPASLAAHDGPLGRACSRIEREGWLFGLLARELGSDVLFERRERQGLRAALHLVREMLAAEDRTLTPCGAPELDSSDPRAADVCAVIARCVYAAHALASTSAWSFSREGEATALCFEDPRGTALERELIAGAARLAGARLRAAPGRSELILPANSVVWP